MSITAHRHPPKRRQLGISLVFALLALIALTLGAVALIRSVDTSVLALGNLAFRQSGVAVATRGAEDAMAWLALGNKINNNGLDFTLVANGYYATAIDSLDTTGRAAGSAMILPRVDWESDGCLVNGQAVAFAVCLQPSSVKKYGADEVRYIILRLCTKEGPIDDTCARPPLPSSTTGNNRGGKDGGKGLPTMGSDFSPYFRIVARTKGPRGTVSFTETLVHF